MPFSFHLTCPTDNHLLHLTHQCNNKIQSGICYALGSICLTVSVAQKQPQVQLDLPGNLPKVSREKPLHLFKVFKSAWNKLKSTFDSKIRWALKPTCGVFTNHVKWGLFWLFLCGSSRNQTVATGLAKRSQPVSKVWSRIPKPLNPLSIWQRKHTHTHIDTPLQPQESPLSKYSKHCPSLQAHPLRHSMPSNQGEMSQI